MSQCKRTDCQTVLPYNSITINSSSTSAKAVSVLWTTMLQSECELKEVVNYTTSLLHVHLKPGRIRSIQWGSRCPGLVSHLCEIIIPSVPQLLWWKTTRDVKYVSCSRRYQDTVMSTFDLKVFFIPILACKSEWSNCLTILYSKSEKHKDNSQ